MNVLQISDAEGTPDAGDYHIDVGSDFEEYSRKKDSCDKSIPCNFYMGIVSLYLKSCAPAQDFLFMYVLIPFSPLGGFLYETNCDLRIRRHRKIHNCL